MARLHGGYDITTKERWACRYCDKNTHDERGLKLDIKDCADCKNEHQVCRPCFKTKVGKVYGVFPNYFVHLRYCPKDCIMLEPIDSFRGRYRFLSNFFPFPDPTLEHHFQAAKAVKPEDRDRIMNAKTPGAAKRMGKKVELRPDWQQVKFGIMEDLLRLKFTTNPGLRAELLDTGNRPLIEGNLWGDVIWGVSGGKGENHLGLLLMKVRAELQKGHKK